MGTDLNCCVCGKLVSRISKHLQAMHPDEYANQERLCIDLYNSGLTAERIAAHDSVIFDNKMSVSRVLRRFIDPGVIERTRRERTADSLSAIGRQRKASVEVNRICSSAPNAGITDTLRALVGVDSSHIQLLSVFAEEIGFSFDATTGIISNDSISVLVIPNSEHFCKYRFLARDFHRSSDSLRPLIFFLDELLLKRDLIKSMVSAKLGNLVGNRVGARECAVAKLDSRSALQFFNENHISGHVTGELYLGLEHQSQLVAAISMRRPFTTKYPSTTEIARFSVLKEHVVSGGFGKLLAAVRSEFGSKYQKVLSYCDMRYGNGHVYDMNGFSEIGRTDPDYCYTDGERRYHRFRYRASGGRSEREIASSASVFRMYGVGSKIYTLSI